VWNFFTGVNVVALFLLCPSWVVCEFMFCACENPCLGATRLSCYTAYEYLSSGIGMHLLIWLFH
jgi:hypothetical protein